MWRTKSLQLVGVFPTPVGMVRSSIIRPCASMSFPHARGDGPFPPPRATSRNRFSPRPWGWSVHQFRLQCLPVFSPRPWGWSVGSFAGGLSKLVFPTPVGMVRKHRRERDDRGSFPHARGDGPRGKEARCCRCRFSPRPWGWSAVSEARKRKAPVFPTPVGMVRAFSVSSFTIRCFPHARGDGPRKRFC